MHRRAIVVTEALLLTGLFGGFIAALSAALWAIGLATGGPGEDEPADRTDISPPDAP